MQFLPGLIVLAILCETVHSLETSFRSDFFLSNKDYDENFAGDAGEEGGRIHIVASAPSGLEVTYPLTVNMGGFKLTLASDSTDGESPPVTNLNWMRSNYDKLSGTVFTSLHVDSNDALTKSINKHEVIDANGQVVAAAEEVSFANEDTKMQVTYVTTRNDYTEMVVHLHNYDSEPTTVQSLAILGKVQDLDAVTIGPGEHLTLTFDARDFQLQEASMWTIALSLTAADGSPAVTHGFGGRLIKELFPIEDWPKGDQYPFPADGCNRENYNTLTNDLHLNTRFMTGLTDTCNQGVILEGALETQGTDTPFHLMVKKEFWTKSYNADDATKYKNVIAGAFLGDESDSSKDNSWEVFQRQQLVEEAQRSSNGPYFATYDGGHVNHWNGQYAGVSDIQGMDFYVAGCAPHITAGVQPMRIQGAYDYLFNTRQNMKPLPTWMYTQAYCKDCWSHYPLYSGELLVQFGSVVASGAKGIMLFQSDVRSKAADETSWDAGSKFLNTVSFLQEILRVSDAEGAKVEKKADENKVITQVLGGPETSMAVFVSTNADSYNDVTCYAGTGRHWAFKEYVVPNLKVYLPKNLLNLAKSAGQPPSSFFEVMEAKNGGYVTPKDVDITIDDDSYTLKDTKLGSSSTVVRMFVLKVKGSSSEVASSSSPSLPSISKTASSGEFNVVQTAENTQDRLTPQTPVPLSSSDASSDGAYSINIDLDERSQKLRGFGGAFTDSTAFNFMQLPEEQQNEMLEAYFGKSGHGYSICRLQIGSSDFAISHYNYANETDDYALESFSIEHDLEYIIPMIHKAQKVAQSNGVELQFVSSPWSPPAWMKRTNRMQNSLMPGLKQEDKVFKAWALYFSKYLTAYKEAGVDIKHVTIQNEPHVAKQFIVTYEACGFDPTHERDFLRDYLGPQLKNDHPDVGIWIHDDQKDDKMIDMVNTIMSDEKAAQYVSGVAFHWYDDWGKNYDVLEQVHEAYPNLPLMGTEATNEKPSMERLHVGGSLWQHGQMYAIDILRDLNNWAEGWIDWNMLLDFTGGPSSQHLGQVKDLGNCDSPIRANFTTFPYYPLDEPRGNFMLMYQPTYYHYGHFTRFLPGGSQRVGLEQSPVLEPNKRGFPGGLESTAFLASEGSEKEQLVIVVTNFLDDPTTYTVNVKGIGSATVNIPAQGIQTLTLALKQ